MRHGRIVEFNDCRDIADLLFFQSRVIERLDDHALNTADEQRLVQRSEAVGLADAARGGQLVDQAVGGFAVTKTPDDAELKAVAVFEIGQFAHAGILAHQQVIFIGEVPGKACEPVALGIGDARQAEIERAGLDQLPDAGARHQADVNFAAAATDQLVGKILVDAAVRVDGIEQAVIVKCERKGTRAIGTGGNCAAEAAHRKYQAT